MKASNDNNPATDTNYNFNYQHLESEYIIFAIDNARDEHPAVNAARFKQWCADRGIGVKELAGMWQSETETSYIANARYEGKFLATWCKHQDAILHLSGKRCRDCYRQATLHYRNGATLALGDFQPISEATALTLDAWTFDPTQNQYWTTSDTLAEAEGRDHA